MKLLIAPHNDDESLFAAFTIMRERPIVLVVFDSYLQVTRGAEYCYHMTRRQETRLAMNELIPNPQVFFAGLRDDDDGFAENLPEKLSKLFREFSHVEHVYAPAIEVHGHAQHNAVGRAAQELFSDRLTHYLTYTRSKGKSRSNNIVHPRNGEYIARKHSALACYKTQMTMDPTIGCWPHFMCDLSEYYA